MLDKIHNQDQAAPINHTHLISDEFPKLAGQWIEKGSLNGRLDGCADCARRFREYVGRVFSVAQVKTDDRTHLMV